MSELRDQLLAEHVRRRRLVLETFDRSTAGGRKPRLFSLATAVLEALAAGLTEWRLGQDDPSPYLRDALNDALRLIAVSPSIDPEDPEAHASAISAAYVGIFASLLLTGSVSEPLSASVAGVHPSRFVPARYMNHWLFPWEAVVIDMCELGHAPPEWDTFTLWLRHRRGGVGDYRDALQKYRDVLDAGRAGDVNALQTALLRFDKHFTKRDWRGFHCGGVFAGQTVDFRLACILNKVEKLRPGLLDQVQTIHRWRW